MGKQRLTPIEKINKLNEKIEKLKQQQLSVQKTFESKITTLLKKEKAFNYDFTILYGGILDLCQKLNNPKNNESDIQKFQHIGTSSLIKKSKSEETKKYKEKK